MKITGSAAGDPKGENSSRFGLAGGTDSRHFQGRQIERVTFIYFSFSYLFSLRVQSPLPFCFLSCYLNCQTRSDLRRASHRES